MHILFVADADSKYGASHSLMDMCSCLIEQFGITISVILTKESAIRERLENLGCTVYCYPYIPFMLSKPQKKYKQLLKYLLFLPYYKFGIFISLRRARKINFNDIDIIHTNSSRENLGAELAKIHSKPHIWHIREFGDSDYRLLSYIKNYSAYMNNNAAQFIAISKAIKKAWLAKGIDSGKIDVIYNGVNETRDYIHKVNDSSPLKLILVGALNETKGQYQAIEALRILNENRPGSFELYLFGDGHPKYANLLKVKCQKYGIESLVHFKGYHNNIDHILKEYDIGLMCSKSEGFGRVTAEYMMAGLAVIASDTGANPELITNNKTGFLYAWNNINSLTQILNKLFDDRTIMYDAAKSGHAYAMKHFTKKSNANKVYRVYNSLLQRKETDIDYDKE